MSEVKTKRCVHYNVERTSPASDRLGPVRLRVEEYRDGIVSGAFSLFDFLTIEEAISLGNLLLTVAHEAGQREDVAA